MAYQSIFKRYEIKYLLTLEQKERVMQAIAPYIAPDQYGRTSIRNIYFDTDSYRLIRYSIERPAYKEKLRLRSYGQASEDSPVFVELKKKYDHVVYKRRLSLPESKAVNWLRGDASCAPPPCQISREIQYFLDYYESLHPTVFLCYEREAWYAVEDPDFRITFDEHILCREEELTLEADTWGAPILPEGKVLMELKTAGSIPLWMTQVLTREHIYKTSFSKYGTAYQTIIFPELKGAQQHA